MADFHSQLERAKVALEFKNPLLLGVQKKQTINGRTPR
jgi:hypothetical protein